MKRSTPPDYCVYRYILRNTGTVIYVGKTDASLKQRIDAHQKEDKFQPYLGEWKVEYVELSNRVETDIVEKFLINSLKPVLNDKDNEDGITSMSITLPEWKSYETYENANKNHAALAEAMKVAKVDDMFFQDVYDTAIEQKLVFVSNVLHPTGLLPLPSGTKRVTELEVENLDCGYFQKLNKNTVNEIISYPSRIRANIWLSVAKLWSYEQRDKERFCELCNELDFAEVLYNFKENGFQEDCDTERGILRFKTNDGILSKYSKLFLKIYPFGDITAVEVDETAYDIIPIILESIAREMLVFFRCIGVIGYEEDENRHMRFIL